jgi:hypothetical protein
MVYIKYCLLLQQSQGVKSALDLFWAVMIANPYVTTPSY